MVALEKVKDLKANLERKTALEKKLYNNKVLTDLSHRLI